MRAQRTASDPLQPGRDPQRSLNLRDLTFQVWARCKPPSRYQIPRCALTLIPSADVFLQKPPWYAATHPAQAALRAALQLLTDPRGLNGLTQLSVCFPSASAGKH